MRLPASLLTIAAFTTAAVLSAVTAGFAMRVVEDGSETGVAQALTEAGLTWAEVDADGLQLYLAGTAPDEAARFRAISTANKIVDAARVIDQINVAETSELAPPRFSIEILRSEGGISLIGLVPAQTDREKLRAQVKALAGGSAMSDLLEVADYPAPEGWNDALRFALRALEELPRSKISVEAGKVEIDAMVEEAAEKASLEMALGRRLPDGVELALQITAPRAVISPFALRFVMDERGPRLETCSAETADQSARLREAAKEAGAPATDTACRIGLGAPSPEWAAAGARAIAAVAELGGGSVSFSNADVSLVAPQDTDPALFDKVTGKLAAELGEGFSLKALLPETSEDRDAGPAEFTATLSPEGQVQLRGSVRGDLARSTTESYARALFGSDAVHSAARPDPALPEGWSVRVLAGLEALALLSNGAVSVTPSNVAIQGNTGRSEASVEIAALLAEKLGEAGEYEIDVTYREALDPKANIPTPEECVAQINAITAERKINFEPGSDTLDGEARGIIDDIADILKTCEQLPLEIGGHTDSQGREVMNEALSQARAESVLAELRARRVLTSTFVAKGYGESQPIADNGTEEGREANRRIEFRLIVSEEAEAAAAGEDAEGAAGTEGATGESATQAGDDGAATVASPDGSGDEEPTEGSDDKAADEQN